jgi:hypothetical protein
MYRMTKVHFLTILMASWLSAQGTGNCTNLAILSPEMHDSVLPQIMALDNIVREDARSIIGNAAGGGCFHKDSIRVHTAEIMQRLIIPEQYLALLESAINIRLADVELSYLSILRRHYLKAIEALREMNEELAKPNPVQLIIQKKALAIYIEIQEADEDDLQAHREKPTGAPAIFPFYRVRESLPLGLPLFAGSSDSASSSPGAVYGRPNVRVSQYQGPAMSMRESLVALGSAQSLANKTGAGIQRKHDAEAAP